MTTTIGRVDFIAELDGKRIPAQAQALGEKIAAAGGPAGEKFSKEFEHGFEKNLGDFGKRIAASMSGDGELASHEFSEGFRRNVQRDFRAIQAETEKALSGKDAFKGFLKGFPTVTAGITALRDNLKRLGQEMVNIQQEGEDGKFITVPVPVIDVDLLEEMNKQITEWGRGAKISETATRKAAAAAEVLKADIAELNRALRDTDAIRQAADANGGLADRYGALKQKIDDLAASNKITLSQQRAMTDQLDLSIAKINEQVAAEERKAVLVARQIAMEHERADVEHQNQLLIERNAARGIEMEHERAKALSDTERGAQALKRAFIDVDDVIGDTRVFRNRVHALGNLSAATQDARRKIGIASALGGDARVIANLSRKLEGLVAGFGSATKAAAAAGDAIAKSLTDAGEAGGKGGKGLGGIFQGAVSGDLKQFVFYLALILSGFQQISAISSGIGASLTALLSSAAFAAAGLGVAILGIGAAFIWMLTHALKAITFMKEEFPKAAKAMDALKIAADNDSRAFAAAWGPALTDFSNQLAKLWREDRLGEMSGRAAGLITQAFTDVLASPAYLNFQNAMSVLLPASLANLGNAAAGIFSGVLNIIAVAAPFILNLTDRIAAFWDTWAKGIQSSADDGTLATTFQAMFQSLSLVLSLVEGLSSALGTLFTAGVGPGNKILGLIVSLVEQFDNWMNSVTGQDALSSWFANGVKFAEVLFKALGDIGAALGTLVTPAAMQRMFDFVEALGGAGTALGALTASIGELDIFGLLAETLDKLGQALIPVYNLLAPIFTIINDLAQVIINGLAIAINFLTPLFAPLTIAFQVFALWIDKAMEVMKPIEDLFTSLGDAVNNAIGIFMDALLPAIGQVIDAFAQLEPSPEQLQAFIDDELGPALNRLAQWMADMVVPAIQAMGDWIVKYLVPVISGLWDLIWNFVIPALEGWLDAFDVIGNAVGPWVTLFVSAIGRLLQPLTDVINLANLTLQVLGQVVQAQVVATNTARAAKTQMSENASSWFGAATTPKNPFDDFIKGIQDAMGNLGKLTDAWNGSPIGISGSGPAAEEAAAAAKKTADAVKKWEGITVSAYNSLVKSVHAGADQAKQSMDGLIETIQANDALLGHQKAVGLVQYVKIAEAQLVKAWTAYDTAATKLKDAKATLTQLLQDRAQLSASVADSLTGGLKLSGARTFKSVSTRISSFAAQLTTFAGLLKNLAKAGVPATLIQQIAALGVKDGTNVAKAILQGTNEQIKQITTDWSTITSAGKQAGDVIAAATFDAGIAAQKGLIKGLTTQTAELKAAATTFADNFAGWVKAALGIHSPSTVFEDIAGDTVQGYADGLDPQVVIAAMQAMVDQITSVAGVTGAFGTMEQAWTDSWSRMLATFTSTWGQISSQISTTFPNGAVTAFSGSSASTTAAPVGTSTSNSKVVNLQSGAIQVVGPDPRRAAIEIVNRIVEVSG